MDKRTIKVENYIGKKKKFKIFLRFTFVGKGNKVIDQFAKKKVSMLKKGDTIVIMLGNNMF